MIFAEIIENYSKVSWIIFELWFTLLLYNIEFLTFLDYFDLLFFNNMLILRITKNLKVSPLTPFLTHTLSLSHLRRFFKSSSKTFSLE